MSDGSARFQDCPTADRATCDSYEVNEGPVPSHHIVVLLLGHFHSWVGEWTPNRMLWRQHRRKRQSTRQKPKRAEALRMAGSVSRGGSRVSGRLKKCRRSEEGKRRRAEKLKTTGPLSLTAFANSQRQLTYNRCDAIDGVLEGGRRGGRSKTRG